ncbi:MAG: hypothetical protein AUJ49_09585 [Desulfovibrionaceae bacterium CG1_02_65_16]|nr:MAG: hypothetical protein AUJ49_09585 [Desulfovibrionaceae bacterium CG1_02_65_16]
MSIRPSHFAYTGILAGISALPPLSIDMNLPALPDIENALGVAQGQGSLTLSLFLSGFSVAPLVGGPLSDRYGRRPVLLVALALISLAALCCALTPTFPLLLVARLAQGVACGVCVLMPLAILRDTQAGASARKKLSIIMLVGGVAPLIAPMLGGWILVLLGWQAIYGAQCAMGLALFCLVACGVAETLAQEKRNAISIKTVAAGYGEIFKSSQFMGSALTQALCFGCMFSYISGSPSFMLGELRLSEQIYSLVFACTSFGVMVGVACGGVLARWEVHPRRIIAAGLGSMCVTVLAVFILTWSGVAQISVLVPALFLVMGSFGLIQPSIMSEAVAPFGHMAGAASGAINSLQMLAGALTCAMVPLLAHVLTPGRAMSASMLGAILLAAGFHALLGRRAAAARQRS